MRKLTKTKHGDYESVVRFPTFSNYAIHVVVTECIVKSAKARYPGSDPSQFGSCPALTVRAESNACHMFFVVSTIYKPYEIAGNLAHESWHATRNLLKWASVDDCPFDSEVVAYHLGFTVERATKFFEEVKYDQERRARIAEASKRRNRG